MSAVGAVCVSDTILATASPNCRYNGHNNSGYDSKISFYSIYVYLVCLRHNGDGMEMGSVDNSGPDGCWFSH